jgi:hypothetical protein
MSSVFLWLLGHTLEQIVYNFFLSKTNKNEILKKYLLIPHLFLAIIPFTALSKSFSNLLYVPFSSSHDSPETTLLPNPHFMKTTLAKETNDLCVVKYYN